MDVWPSLPIEIFVRQPSDYDVENNIATLEHRDRVRSILIIDLTSLCREQLASMMQELFSVLTVLRLIGKTAPALPDMLLGGSAPHIQTLTL